MKDFFGCPRTNQNGSEEEEEEADVEEEPTNVEVETKVEEDYEEHVPTNKVSLLEPRRSSTSTTTTTTSTTTTPKPKVLLSTEARPISTSTSSPHSSTRAPNVFLAGSNKVGHRDSKAQVVVTNDSSSDASWPRESSSSVDEYATQQPPPSPPPPPPSSFPHFPPTILAAHPGATLRESDSILLTIFIGIVISACIATIILAFLTITGTILIIANDFMLI